jgi:hypothetical protein
MISSTPWRLDRFLAVGGGAQLELHDVSIVLTPVIKEGVWFESGFRSNDRLESFLLELRPTDPLSRTDTDQLQLLFAGQCFRVDGWMRNDDEQWPWMHHYFPYCRIRDDQIHAESGPPIPVQSEHGRHEVTLGGFHYTTKGPG